MTHIDIRSKPSIHPFVLHLYPEPDPLRQAPFSVWVPQQQLDPEALSNHRPPRPLTHSEAVQQGREISTRLLVSVISVLQSLSKNLWQLALGTKTVVWELFSVAELSLLTIITHINLTILIVTSEWNPKPRHLNWSALGSGDGEIKWQSGTFQMCNLTWRWKSSYNLWNAVC